MDKSILVVEDDPAHLRALTRQLLGHRVYSVASAEAALEVLLGNEPIAAAVIDIGLPGMSGLELVERIRPARPTLPVLLLSACLDREHVNRASLLGAWYLCKPVTAAELEEVVGRACRLETRAGHIDVSAIITKYALSPREAEVLALALEGLRRDVIRKRLGIRETTVKKTVARLLRKCGAASLRDIESNHARFSAMDTTWQTSHEPPAPPSVNGGKTRLVSVSLDVSTVSAPRS